MGTYLRIPETFALGAAETAVSVAPAELLWERRLGTRERIREAVAEGIWPFPTDGTQLNVLVAAVLHPSDRCRVGDYLGRREVDERRVLLLGQHLAFSGFRGCLVDLDLAANRVALNCLGATPGWLKERIVLQSPPLYANTWQGRPESKAQLLRWGKLLLPLVLGGDDAREQFVVQAWRATRIEELDQDLWTYRTVDRLETYYTTIRVERLGHRPAVLGEWSAPSAWQDLALSESAGRTIWGALRDGGADTRELGRRLVAARVMEGGANSGDPT